MVKFWGQHRQRADQGDPPIDRVGADPFGDAFSEADPFALAPGDTDLFDDVTFDAAENSLDRMTEPTVDVTDTPPAPLDRRAGHTRVRTTRAPDRGAHAAEAASYRQATYFSALVMVVGGAVAAGAVYLAFAEIRPLSTAPLGNALVFGWVAVAALALCLLTLAIAIRGVKVARPRHRPVLTIVLGVLVVPGMVWLAGSLGVTEARRSFQDSAVNDAHGVLVRVLDIVQRELFEDGERTSSPDEP